MDYTLLMPYLWPAVGILVAVILATVGWMMYNRAATASSGPSPSPSPSPSMRENVDAPETNDRNPEERQHSTEDSGDDMTRNEVPS